MITIRGAATIAEAAAMLKKERIGAVVVTDDDGKLEGILSERDIVRGLPTFGANLMEKPVADAMTREVITCSPEDSLDQVMRQMSQGRFRHVPVLDDGALAGIISIGDVVKNRLQELEAETEQLQSYIRG